MSDDEESNSDYISHENLANHPVWQAAAGRGGPAPNAPNGHGPGSVNGSDRARGRGRGRGRGPDEEHERPRFERLSMSHLEYSQFKDGDGADSSIFSEDDRTPKRTRPGPGPSKANGEDRDEDDSDADEDDQAASRAERSERLGSLLGDAVFGGQAGAGASRQFDEESIDESEASSKIRKESFKNVFPCRGITCVGCALAGRIDAVDSFVHNNITRMATDSLYKLAALVYRREVVEPAEREGARVPEWSWKNIKNHFELHVSDNAFSRHRIVKQLQLMRGELEGHIVRVEASGERELDKSTTELLLKTISAESKERALIESASAAKRPVGSKAK